MKNAQIRTAKIERLILMHIKFSIILKSLNSEVLEVLRL